MEESIAKQSLLGIWLAESKLQITNAQEWKQFSFDLTEVVEQQLVKNHVQAFTHLTEEEKKLTLEMAIRTLCNNENYQTLNQRVATTLAQELSKAVSATNSSILSREKMVPERLESHCEDGIVSLLYRWPEMKYKLHRCFNMPLPTKLRQVVWKLFLQNSEASSHYLKMIKMDPKSVMSVSDLEIVQKCESVINSEPTLHPLKTHPQYLHAMKAVLSFHHVLQNLTTSLTDTMYMLVVPFIYLFKALVSPSDMIEDTMVAVLVEQFTSFMITRPLYMTESSDKNTDMAWSSFIDTVAENLTTIDKDLAVHLLKTTQSEEEGSSADSLHGFQSVLWPLVKCLFVGCLSLDTILYVWDQHIIGLDALEYDVIPAFTVILLILLRQQLLSCTSIQEIRDCLMMHGKDIKKEHIMYEIRRCFYRELYPKLMEKMGHHVLHTAEYPMPWQSWQQNALLPGMTGIDRQQAREERQASRKEGSHSEPQEGKSLRKESIASWRKESSVPGSNKPSATGRKESSASGRKASSAPGEQSQDQKRDSEESELPASDSVGEDGDEKRTGAGGSGEKREQSVKELEKESERLRKIQRESTEQLKEVEKEIKKIKEEDNTTGGEPAVTGGEPTVTGGEPTITGGVPTVTAATSPNK